jgi:hypothetical protein
MSDRRRSSAIPRSPVAAARTAHGANRAANALLLQAPPEISGFWCARVPDRAHRTRRDQGRLLGSLSAKIAHRAQYSVVVVPVGAGPRHD